MRMKKSTIILSLALIFGEGIGFAQALLSEMKPTEATQSMPMAQGKLQKKNEANKSSMLKAPSKVKIGDTPEPTDVVNDKPYADFNDNIAGTPVSNLYKSVSGYEAGWFGPSRYSISGVVGEYLYDEANSEIYIYNPVGKYSSYSYIKGSVDQEGNVTVECPQMIAQGEDGYDGPWAYYVMNCKITEDGYSMEPVEDDLNLHFKLEKDGSLSLNQGSWIGMFEWSPYYYYDEEKGDYVDVEGEYFYDWMRYTVMSESMRLFTEEAVHPEKELEVEPWVLAYQTLDDYSSCLMSYSIMDIDACVDGDSFWIKGVVKSEPDCWIKGEIHGDEVTFKDAFICLDERNGYFQFLLAGNSVYDEDEEMYLFDPVGEVTMKFDAEKKTITGSNGNTLFVNAGKETIYYLYMWINPIMKVKEDAAPAAPLAPVFNEYYPADERYDALFLFSISAVDVNFNPLDEDNVYYMILIDGEPFEFTLDELDEVYSEDVTDDQTFTVFPLDFDSYNLYNYYGQINFTPIFIGYDTIGAQAFYVTESGEYLYSAPMIYDINSGTVGVEEVANSHGEISNIEFRGLDGIKVAKPGKGIYLMTVTYSDGTYKTTKIVRK